MSKGIGLCQFYENISEYVKQNENLNLGLPGSV